MAEWFKALVLKTNVYLIGHRGFKSHFTRFLLCCIRNAAFRHFFVPELQISFCFFALFLFCFVALLTVLLHAASLTFLLALYALYALYFLCKPLIFFSNLFHSLSFFILGFFFLFFVAYITQLVRVTVCGSGCHGFNSHYSPLFFLLVVAASGTACCNSGTAAFPVFRHRNTAFFAPPFFMLHYFFSYSFYLYFIYFSFFLLHVSFFLCFAACCNLLCCMQHAAY